MFKLLSKDKNTSARRGVVSTAHGDIQTPFFMPVGTNSTVKSLTIDHMEDLGAQIMLSNTYHLYLRPGCDVMKTMGGLHGLTSWKKPILTDSGGYQVFSLTKLRKLSDEGVKFQSHLDGSRHFFSPEDVIDIEKILGADMIMPLDVCAPYPCRREEALESVRLTTKWAAQSRRHFLANPKEEHKQFLFGIIQGATYEDLRKRSRDEILDIGFDGYAIGGVSVGEPVDEMFKAIDWIAPDLPEDKPRYLMGIGFPDQIVKAVGEGIDMFDTCLPTRLGRHGTAFTNKGRAIVTNAEFASDNDPIDKACTCQVCKRYSRAYIRHLSQSHEVTALTLVSYHNVFFYVNLMKRIRTAINENNYARFQKEFLFEYGSELAESSD